MTDDATACTDPQGAALLRALPRAPQRREIGLGAGLPFLGADLWTACELSWLNPKGKPQVALAQITIPCESTHIVESPSLQRYLHRFANTRLESADAVRDRIRRDVSAAVWSGGPVQASAGVRLLLPDQLDHGPIQELDGLCIDRLELECSQYQPAPELLKAALGEQPVQETLTSHLLQSRCPLTGEPDAASVQVRYSGPQIDQAGLRYLVSFREHSGFREPCVERIFSDIMARCKPSKLMVHARYTRRGGLDINPWRSSHPQRPPGNVRTARQ